MKKEKQKEIKKSWSILWSTEEGPYGETIVWDTTEERAVSLVASWLQQDGLTLRRASPL